MDADAMLRLAAGDDLALNDLMHRWRDRVAAFLLRMTGDHATSCDLAQETFVRLYQSRQRYKPGASFASYIFSIAANLARNFHRWRVRHPTESMESLEKAADVPASGDVSPYQALVQSESARAVQAAIRALPSDLRETLVLFTYHDLGYHEIACIVGCSAKAVETRLYRARQMLKEKLRQFSQNPSAA
jgi:RNA polymerase sigma-70 factor (ECF subfamily)